MSTTGGIDTVVISGNRKSTKRRLHIPDESGVQPLCDHARLHGERGWLDKAIESFPEGWRKWCPYCLKAGGFVDEDLSIEEIAAMDVEIERP